VQGNIIKWLSPDVARFYSQEGSVREKVDILEATIKAIPSLRSRLFALFHSLFKRSAVFKLIHARAEAILNGEGYQCLADQVFYSMRQTFQGFLELFLHELCTDYGLQSIVHQIKQRREDLIEKVLSSIELPQTPEELAKFSLARPAKKAVYSASYVPRVPMFRLLNARLARAVKEAREQQLTLQRAGDLAATDIRQNLVDKLSSDPVLADLWNAKRSESLLDDFVSDLVEPWVRAASNSVSTLSPSEIAPMIAVVAHSLRLMAATTTSAEPSAGLRSIQIVAAVSLMLDDHRASLLTLIAACRLITPDQTRKVLDEKNASNVLRGAITAGFDQLWHRFLNIVEPTGRAELPVWISDFTFATRHFGDGNFLRDADEVRKSVAVMKFALQLWIIRPKMFASTLQLVLDGLVMWVTNRAPAQRQYAELDVEINHQPIIIPDDDVTPLEEAVQPLEVAVQPGNNVAAPTNPAANKRPRPIFVFDVTDSSIHLDELTDAMRDYGATVEAISAMWLWFLRTASVQAIRHAENFKKLLDHMNMSKYTTMNIQFLQILSEATSIENLSTAVGECLVSSAGQRRVTRPLVYQMPFYITGDARSQADPLLQTPLADAFVRWLITSVPIEGVVPVNVNNDHALVDLTSNVRLFWNNYTNTKNVNRGANASDVDVTCDALHLAAAQTLLLQALADFVAALPTTAEDYASQRVRVALNDVRDTFVGAKRLLDDDLNIRAHFWALLAKNRGDEFVQNLLINHRRLEKFSELLGAVTSPTCWILRCHQLHAPTCHRTNWAKPLSTDRTTYRLCKPLSHLQ
jgi:hypothetical protein